MRSICFFLPVALTLFASHANGDPPAWWSEGDPPVIDLAASPNNHGPANIGQAKWMAKRALQALDAEGPTLADAIEADLVGAGKPIPNWDLAIDQAGHDKNHAPLLIGQLKAIAHPFYNHLNSVEPDWVLDQIQQNHNGAATADTHYWQISGNPNYTENGYFPWNPATPPETNKTPATIGQLKAVFSLRFDTLPQEIADTDGDGLPDEWEIAYFGDLSQDPSGDFDKDGLTNAQEFAMGTDPNAVGADADANGLPDDWELANAGQFAVYPPEIAASLLQNQTATSSILLSNDTDEQIDYTISVSGNTGPAYSFKDSLAGGVAYEWHDISQTGVRLDFSNGIDLEEKVVINNFVFPFYGQNYTEVYVNTVGVLTFQSEVVDWWNESIPSELAPPNLIAPFWDDLAPEFGGDIYVKEEADQLVVQFQNVVRYDEDGTFTFQVVLFTNGNIEFRYKELVGVTDQCTVGIQDSTQTIGLQMAYDATYLTDAMAVRISPQSEFFSAAPLVGTVQPHSCEIADGLFQALTLPPDSYTAILTLSRENAAVYSVPVRLNVAEEPAPVETDPYKIDSDGDGLPDWWENYYDLDPSDNGATNQNNGPEGDLDGDGFNNLEEFLANTSPWIADSDADGLPDEWEILYGFDQYNADQNGNGITDGQEDYDGDGIANSGELDDGSDPNDANDFATKIVSISGSAWGHSNTVAYTNTEYPFYGVYRWGPHWTGSGQIEQIVHYAPINPLSLSAVADSIQFPEVPPSPPADQPWLVQISGLLYGKAYSTSRVNYPASGGGMDTAIGVERVWIKTPSADVDQRYQYMRLMRDSVHVFSSNENIPEFVSAEATEFVVPANSNISNYIDLKRIPIQRVGCDVTSFDELIPFEAAPEVLAVNSDFDEGRIDPVTSYAIPDCDDMPGVDIETGAGNTKLELDAVRNHLDGNSIQGDDVTDDLHNGWFGLHPLRLNKEFWDGSYVTIKKIDQIDPETGYKESGQVRFYAKWNGGYYGIQPYDFATLEPVNLVTAGVNMRPGEGVYGSTSTIPNDAEFWMEGVRPGKITLEWRFKKGDSDVKYEQTFRVETRQTVADWQEEVRYQIRLQSKVNTGSEVDLGQFHSGNGFRNTSSSSPLEYDNILRVQAIYYYYKQLFRQMPERFMWAGMAKTAAAPIYAGMSDLTTLAFYQDLGGGYGAGTHILVRGLLLAGQKKICDDMAWAHRAYIGSGRYALDWVETTDRTATNFAAWRELENGIQASDQEQINGANRDLLIREQRDVIQSNYTNCATSKWMNQPKSGVGWLDAIISWALHYEVVAEDPGLGANIGEWLSANAKKNPLPGGPGFRSVVPGGRIDVFGDRWAWTSNAANGMLQIWTGAASETGPNFSASRRLSENNRTLYSASAAYSFDIGGLPVE